MSVRNLSVVTEKKQAIVESLISEGANKKPLHLYILYKTYLDVELSSQYVVKLH